MDLKIKKLHPDAVIPKYATDGSAGLDLTAIDMEYLAHDIIKYYTGLAVEIPVGYVGLLFPRSSVYKTTLRLANCVGVIDSDYRGEITALFDGTEYSSIEYEVGDRIVQLVLLPIPKVAILEVQELAETARGQGGYGSSGR